MSKLKEMLAMGGLAMATAVHPLPTARAESVRVGGIAVGKDNATRMFSPEKRKLFKQEIQSATLARKAQVAGR